MKPKCFFRGCDHKMKTSIAKTYEIINLRRYPPQSANETRKCAGTPKYYTTNSKVLAHFIVILNFPSEEN